MEFAPNFFGGGGGDSAAAILAAFKADPDFGTTGLLANATTSASEVVKVPRATAAVTAGSAVTRNIVGGEEIDEVIQGEA